MLLSKEYTSIIRTSRLVVFRGTIAVYGKQIRCLAGYSSGILKQMTHAQIGTQLLDCIRHANQGLSDSHLLYISPGPVVTESRAVLLTGL